METYEIFKDLAIVIVFAELFALIAKKLKMPQVVGQIIAGLLIGPCVLGLVNQTEFIAMMAEIGVVLIMFSAGLETNLSDLIKTGPKALLIACAGVAIPLLGGFLLSSAFNGFAAPGSMEFVSNLFIGVILTATSVGITVQALKEMGRLKGEMGTLILSAAIIDDIIGIIVLTFVIGMKDPSSDPASVIVNTVLFFVFVIVVGLGSYWIMKKADARWEHHRRIPIFSICICFVFTYVAEHFFGIADITGAYAAGIILCNLKDADYVSRRTDINTYMLFGPIFFASIGLKTEINELDLALVIFSICFVLVGLVTKIIGCGLTAKLMKYSWKDSLKVGVGMMTRGEVALIVAQKGLSSGIIEAKYFTSVILLILVSSIMTPIILKTLYKGEPEEA